jgi:hypothetical protein
MAAMSVVSINTICDVGSEFTLLVLSDAVWSVVMPTSWAGGQIAQLRCAQRVDLCGAEGGQFAVPRVTRSAVWMMAMSAVSMTRSCDVVSAANCVVVTAAALAAARTAWCCRPGTACGSCPYPWCCTVLLLRLVLLRWGLPAARRAGLALQPQQFLRFQAMR